LTLKKDSAKTDFQYTFPPLDAPHPALHPWSKFNANGWSKFNARQHSYSIEEDHPRKADG
jgi:hypothetical protein